MSGSVIGALIWIFEFRHREWPKGVAGQPFVDARTRKTQRLNDHLGRFALFDPMYGPNPNLLDRSV